MYQTNIRFVINQSKIIPRGSYMYHIEIRTSRCVIKQPEKGFLLLKGVPNTFMTQEVCKKVVAWDAPTLVYVPDMFRT